RLDDPLHLLEVLGEQAAQGLRVERLAELGRAGDVAEEDGDRLPLLEHGFGRSERRPARVAEAGPGAVLAAARRTDHGNQARPLRPDLQPTGGLSSGRAGTRA